jgi:hypothetical protein
MLVECLILAVQAATPQMAAGAADPYNLQIPRIASEPRIDGKLDEPVWQQAARLSGFHQFQPVDSRPAEEQTEVLVWYSPSAIYFGVRAHAKDPRSIRATLADRDKIGNDDRVTIYLDTFNDRRRAFIFGVNPLGVQLDGVRTEGAVSAGSMFGGSIDYNPDFTFDSKGEVTEDGYTVEVRIPFKSLRFPSTAPQTWGLNVVRDSPSTGYEDTWTDVKRASASFLNQAGTISGLHDLERGVVAEVQPFVTATANGQRDATSGAFDRDNMKASTGANLRLGFTQVSLDATINPDFSQVESDAGLVRANERFELFISEKRPFFLEGIELFATPNQLVYSRRISDPAAGAKVTGKLGAYSIAYLSAIDDRPERNAVFNVARLRRDLGGNSIGGLTLADVEQGGRYNRVAALDTRIVFKQLYYFEPQIGGSWSHQTRFIPLGAPALPLSFSAPLWKLELDRTGRAYGFNYLLNGLGNDFVDDAGFVPRVGIVNAHGFNRFSWYGARGAFFENLTTYFGPTRVWNYHDFAKDAPIEGREEGTVTATMRGGWRATGTVAQSFFTLVPSTYSLLQVDRGAGVVSYTTPDQMRALGEWYIQLGSPVFQLVNATVDLRRLKEPIFAEGSEGRETRSSLTLSLRPTPLLRIDGTGVYSRITRARDGSEFARTIIPRLKVEYQVARPFFVRVVGEYQSTRASGLRDWLTGRPLLFAGSPVPANERGSLRVDWLASYRPTPGTVAFFGYGSSQLAPTANSLSGLQKTEDGFFLKFAYQFRN